MKLYYITRTFYPFQKGGGPLARTGAVKYLQELGWDVVVIMPNYNSKEIKIEENIIQIPFKSKFNKKISLVLEMIGIYEDYLDRWVVNAFEYLKNKINQNDIIFVTTGGELGTIKLGSLLKSEINCKLVINYRDPLNYAYMNGYKRDKLPHVNRDKLQEKYMENVDLVITSSEYYANVLKKRFVKIKNKVHNNYFGYLKEIDLRLNDKNINDTIRIAYAGSIGKTQRPEILYEVFKLLKDKVNIEIYFIGNRAKYKPLQNINDSRVHFIDLLPHDEFLKFMTEEIDIGFVCLPNNFFSACVPSKIYEYINLGLPILGALPDGDGKNIINNFGLGLACSYNTKELSILVELLQNKSKIQKFRKNILNHKKSFAMNERIKEVNILLKKLV